MDNELFLTIAAMSATIGSISALFFVFFTQQILHLIETICPPGSTGKRRIDLRSQMFLALYRMLKISVLASTVILLANAFLIVINIYLFPSIKLGIITIVIFHLGIECLVIPLFIFVINNLRYTRDLVKLPQKDEGNLVG